MWSRKQRVSGDPKREAWYLGRRESWLGPGRGLEAGRERPEPDRVGAALIEVSVNGAEKETAAGRQPLTSRTSPSPARCQDMHCVCCHAQPQLSGPVAGSRVGSAILTLV